MSKKNIIILIISIIILILATGVFIYAKTLKSTKSNNKNTNSTSKTTPIKEEEKNFYFYDYDGNTLDLSNFSDKPTILLLWKSDSSKSYDMISLLEKYYEENKDKLNILAVNVNEPNLDLEIVKNVKAAQFKIPMYFDKNLSFENKYQCSSLPSLLFIEQDGTVSNQVNDVITEDSFIANIDLLLKNF